MGRHKVSIKKIEDATRSQVTFSKRRNGLIKKIHELSTLCDVDAAVVAFSPSGRVSQYPTDNNKFMETLNRYVNLSILDRDYGVDDPKFHLNQLSHIKDDGDKIIAVNREIKRYEQLKAIAELELHMTENKLRCFDKKLPRHATSLTDIRWQKKFLTNMLNRVRRRKELLIQGSLMNEEKYQMNMLNQEFDNPMAMSLQVGSLLQSENDNKNNNTTHGEENQMNPTHGECYNPIGTGLHVDPFRRPYMDNPMDTSSHVDPLLRLCSNNNGKGNQMDMPGQEYPKSDPQAYAAKELDIPGAQIQNYEDASDQDAILSNNQTSPANASDDFLQVDDDGITIPEGLLNDSGIIQQGTTLMNEASTINFSDDFLQMDDELSFLQDLLNDPEIIQLETAYMNEEASTTSPSNLSFLQGLLIDPNIYQQQDAAYANEETVFNDLFQKSDELSSSKDVLNEPDITQQQSASMKETAISDAPDDLLADDLSFLQDMLNDPDNNQQEANLMTEAQHRQQTI